VILRIPTVLRRFTGGAGEVEARGATVGEALEDLFRRHADLRSRVLDGAGEVRPYLLLFRNGQELPRKGARATPLGAGDVLEIVGGAEGG
jgi:hypothetical protein